MPRFLVAFAGLLVGFCVPTAAWAEDVPTVVVPIVVGETAVRSADLHEAVVRAARFRARIRIMSSEEAFVSGAKLEELEACGVDPECLGRELSASHASLALIVLANAMTDPPLLALRLVDVKSRKIIATSAAPLDPAEHSIALAVAARAGALFEQAAFERRARVRVDVSPADAIVAVSGGEPDPADPSAFMVPIGRAIVHAERAGYIPRDIEVVAEAGTDVGVSVVLELESDSGLLSSPWFWTATIGAVVLGGALVYVGVQSARCVCIASAGKPCSC